MRYITVGCKKSAVDFHLILDIIRIRLISTYLSGYNLHDRMERMSIKTFVVVVVFVIFSPLVSLAQDPPVEFGGAIEVRIVNLDVYVTDKKGNPVVGLRKEDFELFEDGKKVEITHFREIREGKLVYIATPGVGEKEVTEPSDFSPELAQRDPVYLVIYVDNLNLKPFDRNKVLTRLRAFLRKNLDRTRDKVMLVVYNRNLEIRVPFTSDFTVVNRELIKIEEEVAMAVHRENERRLILNELGKSDPDEVYLETMIENYSGSQYNDLSFTIDALRDTVVTLASLPGKRVVIYVSSGLEMTPGEDLWIAFQQRFEQRLSLNVLRDYNLDLRFKELTRLANTNDVVFYTIDAAGLRTYTSVSAQIHSAGREVFLDNVYFSNLQDTLRMMAEETGGFAILNTNDITPFLERITKDINTYYSIAYSPSRPSDGRFHSLKVKVKRKGVRVRYKRGYRDRLIEDKMRDSLLSAIVHSVYKNPLNLNFEVLSVNKRSDRFYNVNLIVLIPIGKLAFVPQGDTYTSNVSLFIVARDSEDNTSEVQEKKLVIKIPAGEWEIAKDKNWGTKLTLMMRGGIHKLGIGLYDHIGGVESFVVRAFDVKVSR